jgi:hypothetical protein
MLFVHERGKPCCRELKKMVAFSNTGPVWTVSLDEGETQKLTGLLAAGGPLAPAAGPLAPAVLAAIGAGVGYITTIDKLSGNNGVDVNGVVGTVGIIVIPRGTGFYQQLVRAAKETVAVHTVIEFLIAGGAAVPSLGADLGIGAAASIFGRVAAGVPLGWAVAAATVLGLIIGKGPGPDPNEHGGVHADRTAVGDWERFTLAQIGEPSKVSLLAWQGLFSAQPNGDVYANRPQVGPWETWNMVANPDNTVSLQSTNGHYLSALNGGGPGSYCKADKPLAGNWEKFFVQNLPGGHIALKTHDRGTFLSVQPGK